ncbi:MAG: transcription antitermination protein NusB [Sodaliphilus sp.]|nr:transcription antitermination protein NusB [Bacteroidales bacterium]MDY4685666.1 transcription antitermination protein NusB [Sodaliphilus sp.]HAO62437.1 transcription antitermination factor NusB [Porphyromonadaceae bacterium]MDY5019469.1 transcription antitermination protein NusB [Sodaliphilus sp.]MDY5418051.1 transcription antitermination protein NusB [Sodaliphilus sp.]
MINRVLIRAKVVQMLYAYMVSKDSMTLTTAKKELTKSLDKSYELYNALLKLMIELTDVQDLRLDEAKHKFLPTEEDLNPNMRFVENEFVKRLRADQTLADFVDDKKINWRDDELFVRLLLDKILRSEEYQEYMEMPKTSLVRDGEVWYQLMKKVVLPDENLLEHLQSMSVYYTDDDLQIMGQFVMKTIRRFEDEEAQPILPQYKNDDDSKFGEQLFSKAVAEMEENNSYIDQFVKTEKWDVERIALMDRVVMCTALTEIRNYPSIPVNVSLNEYIELAKDYSTPRSGQFVNGILNAVVNKLRADKVIIK